MQLLQTSKINENRIPYTRKDLKKLAKRLARAIRWLSCDP
jgi:hypothetical protein